MQPPATLAEAARQRRDIVSGAVMEEARLIRFAAGPDGQVVPDLGRKLSGRGLWVAADRVSVETAAKKGLFSRAARTKLTPAPDLADQVELLLMRRLLEGLGLARRGGALISGFEKVLAAIRGGKAAWLVDATDAAEDGRRKLFGAARKAQPSPALAVLFSSAEMSLALGGENVIHTALLTGRATNRWTSDAQRLSGFRPLLPESWREEPREGGS